MGKNELPSNGKRGVDVTSETAGKVYRLKDAASILDPSEVHAKTKI